MTDLWKELGERVKQLAGTWTAYTALGSFFLYLLGYLSLRFHLTAIGIGTDLAALDERYLFAGAKFLVYLVASVPIVVLLVLILAATVYIPYRSACWIIPGNIRKKLNVIIGNRWEKISSWWSKPTRFTLGGIIFSVVMIQFVMRQCFLFSNLLLVPSLPEPGWLRSLLLSEDAYMSLYFSGLLAGTAVTGGLFLLARGMEEGQTNLSRFMVGLLAFLFAVQLLMLPVNYGILITDKVMAKVASLDGQKDLEKRQEAWLVWEGKEGVTYLIRGSDEGKETRKLITLPRKDIKKVEIIAYDTILRVIFFGQEKGAMPQQDSAKEKNQ